MSKRMDFWEWLDTCPVDYQLDNDDGMDMTFTFFFDDDEELEIVFEPEEDTGLDFNKAIKLVVDNDAEQCRIITPEGLTGSARRLTC